VYVKVSLSLLRALYLEFSAGEHIAYFELLIENVTYILDKATELSAKLIGVLNLVRKHLPGTRLHQAESLTSSPGVEL
jgi:hypothetical protein